MWLKIGDSYLTHKVTNRSLNVHEWVEIMHRNKDAPLSSLWIVSASENLEKVLNKII